MEPLPKSIAKFVKSLQLKKYRVQEQSFLVEGAKNISELLNSDFEVNFIVGVPGFLESIEDKGIELYRSTEKELSGLGTFKTNNSGIAVAKTRDFPAPGERGLILALDRVSDPGNLGTIIRTADWFGISQIVASENTVEFFNPKVINATMGSFSRVFVHYCDLELYLKNFKGEIWAADLSGESLEDAELIEPCVVIMGSESHGISEALLKIKHKPLTVPAYGKAESLNVSIAAALVMNRFRTRK